MCRRPYQRNGDALGCDALRRPTQSARERLMVGLRTEGPTGRNTGAAAAKNVSRLCAFSRPAQPRGGSALEMQAHAIWLRSSSISLTALVIMS